MKVCSLLSALLDLVVGEDGILQVVSFVHERVEELSRVGDSPQDEDGHVKPRGVEDESLIRGMGGPPCFFYFMLRASELAEDWGELGEVRWGGIVIGENTPMTVNIEIVADHCRRLRYRSIQNRVEQLYHVFPVGDVLRSEAAEVGHPTVKQITFGFVNVVDVVLDGERVVLGIRNA